ncbi:MAG: ferredoxin [Proteobacteria bacterium]|nr:ferredoxin [Pseudomonadota bacterium]MBU1639727.1 ferredoxin [Pseudomonadota bacterium]
MQKVRVFVDSYRCKWCEACVVEMPEIFSYDEMTGKVAAIGEVVELTPALESTIVICPTKCIYVEEM